MLQQTNIKSVVKVRKNTYSNIVVMDPWRKTAASETKIKRLRQRAYVAGQTIMLLQSKNNLGKHFPFFTQNYL